jgi:hypothetical protein
MEVNTSGDGRLEQQFRTKVEDLLQTAGKQKAFRLSLTVSYLLLPVGVSPDGQVSRYNVAMKTDYNVTRISDGKNFDKGSLQVQVSYNASISADYATFISNREAVDRGTAELAEVLRSRLITAFYGQSDKKDAENGD